MPNQVRWIENKDNPPLDFGMYKQENISARARDLIEALEPGIHQFFPVQFVNRRGTFLEERYWLVVCNRLDGVNPGKSNVVMATAGWIAPDVAARLGYDLPDGVSTDRPTRLVFNQSAIAGKHFWQDQYLSNGPFMSNEATRAIVEAGLTGIEINEKTEIEEV